MITQLSITGFRCFRQLDVELKPLTVLIGPNDTGKSAFLDAFHLLGQPSRSIDTRDFFRGGESRRICFDGQTVSGEEFQQEREWPDQWPAERLSEIARRGFGSMPACERFQLPVEGIQTECVGFDEGEVKQLNLESNGNRVAALLDHLQRDNHQQFELLISDMRAMVPGLERLKIATPTRERRRVDFVIENGFVIPASRVSAGVRLLLFFLALVHHPNPPKIILLEEPETGIHPKRLGDVMNLLRGITQGKFGKTPTQVILTTHSPYLLDYVKPEEDQVLVFQRADDGSRTAKPVDWGRLKEYFDGFMLGEIWFNEEEAGMVAQEAS